MSDDKYLPGSFQRTYLTLCEQLGQPLSEGQIDALDTVVQDTFRVKPQKNEALERFFLKQPVDLNALKQPVDLSSLKEDFPPGIITRVTNELGFRYDELTNESALDLYQKLQEKQQGKGPKIRMMGHQSTRLLETYLKTVGILDPESSNNSPK